LIEYGTLNRKEGGAVVERGKKEGGNVRVRMSNWEVMKWRRDGGGDGKGGGGRGAQPRHH